MTAADRRKLNKDAGFSLLELLIAVVILAIIVIPLLNLFLSSNKLNIKSRQTLRATTAAQDIMEGLKAYNMEEIRAQFDDPASGFYVIDSRMIKGGVKEEAPGMGNPTDGLYVFSMKELNMQGSKFDAKVTMDGRGYMDAARFPGHSSHTYSDSFFKGEKCTVCGAFRDGTKHKGIFNDAAMADARSIDKKNGTFVEGGKYWQRVMKTACGDSVMEPAIKNKLTTSGVAAADLDTKYENLWDETKSDYLGHKNAANFFDKVTRTITLTLANNDGMKDEKGNPKVSMVVNQTYSFTCAGVKKDVVLDDVPCGNITRIVDDAGGSGGAGKPDEINVNLFYYPIYGPSSKVEDKIIVKNGSDAKLNLLIAKQRYDSGNLSDPEYLMDAQLKVAERDYRVAVAVQNGGGSPLANDQFSLKTNLGLNLVGEKFLREKDPVTGEYVLSPEINVPAQLTVNGTNMGLTGVSGMDIFTLDGVRSPMGKDPDPGEITELIYDVEVAVYEEGAAEKGFPDDMRRTVIAGSMMN